MLTLRVPKGAPLTHAELDENFKYLGPRRNAIINGDFNVWQRGTSFVGITNDTYAADRWVYNKVGAMVHDVSRSSDVPTVAQAGRLFNYSILVDCTTVDASIAAGDFCTLAQRIEGYNWLTLAQRSITLSFWVKATKTGTYCVALNNSGIDRSYVAEYTINAADVWERKTVTFTASPSAGTWNYTNGIGARMFFTLASGSTFQTTAGTWQTGNFIGTANQVNACDNVANDFRIAGVQLEAGNVATEFEQRTVQEELALCRRYYSKTYDQAIDPATITNVGARHSSAAGTVAGRLTHVYEHLVMMRAAPTVVVYSGATGASGNWRRGDAVADVAMTSSSSEASTRIENTAAVTDGEQVLGHVTASAEL